MTAYVLLLNPDLLFTTVQYLFIQFFNTVGQGWSCATKNIQLVKYFTSAIHNVQRIKPASQVHLEKMAVKMETHRESTISFFGRPWVAMPNLQCIQKTG